MKYQIKGIDCAHCALKIEDALNNNDQINKAQIDFVNEKVDIEYTSNEDLNLVNEIVASVEKGVLVSKEAKNKYVYQLSGVDCADCALKIEDNLRKQEYIETIHYNFSSQKLTIVYDKNNFIKVEKLIKDIESDAIMSEDMTHNLKDNLNYKILISIIMSFVLIILTFIFPLSSQTKFIIYLITLLIAGYDIFLKVIKNLFKGNIFDENFLMGIATIAAFAIGEYIEAIAIVLFYKIGELFQDLAVNRSRSSITSLLNIKSEYANIIREDGIEKVNPEQLQVDDLILVKVGEKIPVDGIVVEGDSLIDNSALTGESKLVEVFKDVKVLSGSINTSAVLKIKVSQTYSDSTVAKILDLVENASSNKAPTENYITKFARVYTPIVVLIATLVALIPPFVLGLNDFSFWLYKACIFLVISCPCALVISIPLSFFGGIGSASKNGILIKGANYLEALSSV
ncbi:MAG: heavy metal translocating P-type ATPase, partial [Bacilli bacterium]